MEESKRLAWLLVCSLHKAEREHRSLTFNSTFYKLLIDI